MEVTGLLMRSYFSMSLRIKAYGYELNINPYIVILAYGNCNNRRLIHFVHHQQGKHNVILRNYKINTSEFYVTLFFEPGWYHFFLFFLNRPRVQYGADFSDWPRRVLWGRILRGRHQGTRPWNCLDFKWLFSRISVTMVTTTAAHRINGMSVTGIFRATRL